MTTRYKLNVVYTDNTQKNFEGLIQCPYREQGFLMAYEPHCTHNINLAHVFGYTVEGYEE